MVFDASGSTDDTEVTGYSWSTGGNGRTETVTFDQVGTHYVELTVTDGEGLTASATATVNVEKKPIPDDYISNFKQLSYRGTSNGWAAQAMELVADHTWQTTITLTGAWRERFKLDASEDMSETYGDRDDDGGLDKNTVIYPGYRGTFTLTVNDQTMSYTLEKQGQPYVSNIDSLYYSAPKTTGRGWDVLPMKLVADHLWYIRVKWNDIEKQRFRFDLTGQAISSEVPGDRNNSGIADVGGLPIYKAGKGYFIIKLNDRTMKYSILAP